MDTLNSILKFIGNKIKTITDKYTDTGIVATDSDFNITCNNLNINGTCNTTYDYLVNNVKVVDSGTVAYTGTGSGYGSWIRLYDGTQIIWRRGTYNMTAPNSYSASGNTLYQGVTNFTFPVVFVGDAPTIGTGECHWGASASWCAVSNIGLDFVGLRLMDITKRDASETTRYGFVAIGRWK